MALASSLAARLQDRLCDRPARRWLTKPIWRTRRCAQSLDINLTGTFAVARGTGSIIRLNAIAGARGDAAGSGHHKRDKVRAACIRELSQRRYASSDEIASAAVFLLDNKKSPGHISSMCGWGFVAAGFLPEGRSLRTGPFSSSARRKGFESKYLKSLYI